MTDHHWHRVDVAVALSVGILLGVFAGASLVYWLEAKDSQEREARWERLRDAESKVRWLEDIQARKARKKGYK